MPAHWIRDEVAAATSRAGRKCSRRAATAVGMCRYALARWCFASAGSRAIRASIAGSGVWTRIGSSSVGDQALMRGLATAFPRMRPGLSLSYSGRRTDRPHTVLTGVPLPWPRPRPCARDGAGRRRRRLRPVSRALSRATAHMNAASSRAIAVQATVGLLAARGQAPGSAPSGGSAPSRRSRGPWATRAPAWPASPSRPAGGAGRSRRLSTSRCRKRPLPALVIEPRRLRSRRWSARPAPGRYRP